MDFKFFMNVNDASIYSGLPVESLCNLVRNGKLSYCEIDGEVYFTAADFAALQRRSTTIASNGTGAIRNVEGTISKMISRIERDRKVQEKREAAIRAIGMEARLEADRLIGRE